MARSPSSSRNGSPIRSRLRSLVRALVRPWTLGVVVAVAASGAMGLFAGNHAWTSRPAPVVTIVPPPPTATAWLQSSSPDGGLYPVGPDLPPGTWAMIARPGHVCQWETLVLYPTGRTLISDGGEYDGTDPADPRLVWIKESDTHLLAYGCIFRKAG